MLVTIDIFFIYRRQGCASFLFLPFCAALKLHYYRASTVVTIILGCSVSCFSFQKPTQGTFQASFLLYSWSGSRLSGCCFFPSHLEFMNFENTKIVTLDGISTVTSFRSWHNFIAMTRKKTNRGREGTNHNTWIINPWHSKYDYSCCNAYIFLKTYTEPASAFFIRFELRKF